MSSRKVQHRQNTEEVLRKWRGRRQQQREEIVRMARQVERDRQAAATFLAKAELPYDSWQALICSDATLQTAVMLQMLALMAGDVEEQSPGDALKILSVADDLTSRVPHSAFGYAYARLKMSARKSAALVAAGRHRDAWSEIADARRWIAEGCSNVYERAELLVERVYLRISTGKHTHAVCALELTLRIFAEFGLVHEHDRALRVLRHARTHNVEAQKA